MDDREIRETKANLATIKAAFSEQPAHTAKDVREAMLKLVDVLDRLLTTQQQANRAPQGAIR